MKTFPNWKNVQKRKMITGIENRYILAKINCSYEMYTYGNVNDKTKDNLRIAKNAVRYHYYRKYRDTSLGLKTMEWRAKAQM